MNLGMNNQRKKIVLHNFFLPFYDFVNSSLTQTSCSLFLVEIWCLTCGKEEQEKNRLEKGKI
jgi:hypothetical protein